MIVLALTTTLAAAYLAASWWWTRTLVHAIARADRADREDAAVFGRRSSSESGDDEAIVPCGTSGCSTQVRVQRYSDGSAPKSGICDGCFRRATGGAEPAEQQDVPARRGWFRR
ncbi:hypothetical protein FH609_004045 [Streptomyces sp. 3MP-14]|uniref:Uncharacterized protein n=1 Tax=Streptomyces mimosae TaxID=2586635 RepID=A0A5N6A4R1_9ACTN|nr:MULTISPECIES: hypothetical protein [Streptomyces]KAB8162906.1 hypothetical protein FH607_019910 [Streptomyces mimosae]KAB8179119.1 hypothetical protein FH609_004045 [Streptomyces sp. 3MP-14]